MEKKWTIRQTKRSDAQGIFILLLMGWLDTYINDEIGVTREFILDRRVNSLSYRFFKEECRYEYFENNDNNLHYIAEDEDGLIVGVIHGSKEEGVQELEGLYVYKELQGSGLAQELARKFIEWEDQGVISKVNVVEYNARAIKFYEKLGFKDSGGRNLFIDKIPCIDMTKKNLVEGDK